MREGSYVDEEAAERALEYFRKSAADETDDDDLRPAAIGFSAAWSESGLGVLWGSNRNNLLSRESFQSASFRFIPGASRARSYAGCC